MYLRVVGAVVVVAVCAWLGGWGAVSVSLRVVGAVVVVAVCAWLGV